MENYLEYIKPIKTQNAITKIENPIIIANTSTFMHRTSVFESSIPIIHFSGFEINKKHEIIINIINISSKIQRMSIIPPNETEFTIEYKKIGTLASGLSQQIKIYFNPSEYRYYKDFIRIRSENETLIIPLHGYPVINQIDFPSNISFGKVPLLKSVVKYLTLKCSIPINYSFSLNILQPHPYFNITPTGMYVHTSERNLTLYCIDIFGLLGCLY